MLTLEALKAILLLITVAVSPQLYKMIMSIGFIKDNQADDLVTTKTVGATAEKRGMQPRRKKFLQLCGSNVCISGFHSTISVVLDA